MTRHVPEVEILLGLGGTFRRVPLASLAAVLHVPLDPLRESFSRLLFSLTDRDDEAPPSPAGREPTEGGDGTVRYGSLGTVPEEQKTVSDRTVPFVPADVPSREASSRPPSSPDPLTAEILAVTLDDTASLPFYRALVARVDMATLQTALAETCARRHEIRGSPGAYFTAIVRRFTQTPLYARTPPAPP